MEKKFFCLVSNATKAVERNVFINIWHGKICHCSEHLTLKNEQILFVSFLYV